LRLTRIWNASAGTDPKTSEFAFFKKLKKDASEGFRIRPLQKESRQSSKKPESTDYSRGWLNFKDNKFALCSF